MPKPVSGSIYYDSALDRPRVDLRSGSKRLLTEDDSTGGTLSDIDSPDGSLVITNPTGPTVSVEANFGTGANTVMEGNQSAGGDVSGTLSNLSVEALNTTGASVNVGLAVPPVVGQVLVATDATHVTWQTLNLSEFWAPPAVAHADSDEFLGNALSGSWTLSQWDSTGAGGVWTTFASAGAVDSTSSPAASTCRLTIANSRLAFQPALNFPACIRKQISVGNDYRVSVRMRSPIPFAGVNPGSPDVFCAFSICSDEGGIPDLQTNANYVQVAGLMSTTNSFVWRVHSRQAGGINDPSGPNTLFDTANLDTTPSDCEFVFIHRRATDEALVYMVCGSTRHLIMRRTSGFDLGTNPWLVFHVATANTATAVMPFAPIYEVDYIRVRADAQLL